MASSGILMCNDNKISFGYKLSLYCANICFNCGAGNSGMSGLSTRSFVVWFIGCRQAFVGLISGGVMTT